MLHSNRCVLHGKNERELALLHECPLDPGGYFVVNGTERVILMQEQLSNNRILVELDARKNICATVTSSTAASKSRTLVYLAHERLFVKTNKFREDVPAVVVLKAMGVESDLEVARLVGEDFLPLMALSIEHCRSLGVDTEEQALAYIGARVRRAKEKAARPKKDEARFILISVVLSHLPAQETDFYEKAIYLAVMIRRVFMVHSGRISLDDKDYYGNKRLELF